MIDFIIVAVFELILLLLIVGTLREWQKSKCKRELLPILAYLLAMLSFLGSPHAGIVHPWFVGFIWIGIGVVVRMVVRRRTAS
jgi:ABC-type Co2+ transport system permease subunit